MSIEQMVQAWKDDENELEANAVENPVGKELTNDELEEIVGGMSYTVQVVYTNAAYRRSAVAID